MANNTRNVKFNFDDGGSLRKLKSMYDDLARSIFSNASLYARNTTGNPAAQQSRYIREEISALRDLTEARKADYDAKSRQLEALRVREEGLLNRHRKGKLSDSDLASEQARIASETRNILKGTGYRKASTYLSGEGGTLSREEETLNKIEKTLENSANILRNILSSNRETALALVEAIENDANAGHDEKMAAEQARNILEKRMRSEEDKTKNKNDILSELLRFSNINSLLNNAGNILTSNSAIEAMRKAGHTAIELGVGGADMLSKVLGKGAEKWLGEGAGAIVEKGLMLGARAAGVAGRVGLETKIDSYQANQDFERQLLANQAMTGRGILPFSASTFGYNSLQSAQLMANLARSAGTSRGLDVTTRNAQLLERGFGIRTDVSSILLELIRTNKETDKNLISIVGGIYNAGQNIFKGDRTYLGEFISRNFAGLQRELLKNQSSVRSGLVTDVLMQFGSVGGQFDPRHPNAMNLITSINNSISNPQSGTMDALTFAALRQSMPGASLGELLREREKGLGSPRYFRSILDQLERFGGSEDFQTMQLASALGINYNAATDLYRNRGKLKNFSDTELSGYIGGLEEMAASQTVQVDKHAAELQDAMITGAFEKISTLIDQMKEVWQKTWSGATYTVDPATGRLTVSAGTVVNVSKKPTSSPMPLPTATTTTANTKSFNRLEDRFK